MVNAVGVASVGAGQVEVAAEPDRRETLERRRHRTSYLSEHTIEYYLVPRFRQALAIEFTSTLGFFFWASREGSIASRSVCCQEPVRPVAVYRRRRKLGADRSIPIMKVNGELFRAAAEFRHVGFPV